ncbi:Toprim domain-containing protein [Acidovorax sp. 69]|uniref:toprim domain-containing protein n=1 Tax=Acidovorax sp. 69 TaxID=2035202 RepID=UPI000C2304E7|nr:toprim domain-containing protein [Acidovorax sp. 69]PJI96447.1 Toprim domain-containing protein [Acidovorax sp. 69]
MNALNSTVEFIGAIQASLGHAPQHLEPGRFCRFGPKKSGWAKLFSDGLGGVFGDYRQNTSSRWSAHQPQHQSPAELAAMRQHIAQAAREREADERIQWNKNAERNARLWKASAPAGASVRNYLAQRGLGDWAIPSCIRQHSGLAYWHTDDDGVLQELGRFPAMLAPIVRDGNLLAIHRTYLAGGKKADVPTPKKLTAASASLAGACIPLAAPRGGVLGIAEGIETAAAASLGSGLPVVAAYCANALSGFHWPRGIDRLVIFADNDPAGQQAAAALAQRANKAGINNKTLTPSRPGADWADVWLEGK